MIQDTDGITVSKLRETLEGLPGDTLVVLSRGEFAVRDDNFSPLVSVQGLEEDGDTFYLRQDDIGDWAGTVSNPESREIAEGDGETEGVGPRCLVLVPLTPWDMEAPKEETHIEDFDERPRF